MSQALGLRCHPAICIVIRDTATVGVSGPDYLEVPSVPSAAQRCVLTGCHSTLCCIRAPSRHVPHNMIAGANENGFENMRLNNQVYNSSPQLPALLH